MHPRTRILGTVTACLASAVVARAQTTQPGEAVETPANFAASQREALAQLRAQSPETPARPIDAIVKLDIREGELVATRVDPAGPDEELFSAAGDPSTIYRVSVQHIKGPVSFDVINVHVMHYDAAGARAVNVDLTDMIDTNVTVTVETLGGTTSAQYIEKVPRAGMEETAPIARLYMSRDEEAAEALGARRDVAESSFAALVVAHHEEAVAMLGEGLSMLRGMHVLSGVSQAQARAIFEASRPVDAATVHELDAIVKTLEERGRDAVPELRLRLRKLGSAAAASLQARPRGGWSVDLALNVDTLTADLMPGGQEESAALLASSDRLIDLLYSPDMVVRRGALDRLNTLTGKKLSIDIEGDPYASLAQIESLRSGPHATAPTTEPASVPDEPGKR